MSVPGSNFSTVDELVNPFRALIVTLKTDYADSDTTRKRKNRYRENLRDEAVDAFDDVLELLKVGVTMWLVLQGAHTPAGTRYGLPTVDLYLHPPRFS